MAVIALLLAGGLLTATALLAALSLRLGTGSTLLAIYLLAAGEVVGATELLSLVHGIGTVGYATLEAIAFVAALVVWRRAGQPRPTLARPRLDPVTTALVVVAGVAVVYELLIGFTAPNGWDTMQYHLARAAAWRAQGSLDYFGTHSPIANTYPQNGEMSLLYGLVLAGRDTFAALPQLLASLATAVGISVIARRLGSPRRPALFVGLLFLTLSDVAIQTVTAQNDLVETSFVVAAVALALGSQRRDAALAGLAIGLAIGAKLTFFYALPALLLLGWLVLPRRRLVAVAAASVAGVALFGSYAYVQNLVESGRPQGNAPDLALQPDWTVPGTISTVFRVSYRLIDLSGFHPPEFLTGHLAGAAKRVFAGLGVPTNPPESSVAAQPFGFTPQTTVSEGESGFGPLAILLIVPLSVGFLLAWARRRVDRRIGAFALVLPLWILAVALGTRWNPYVERYLTPAIALTLPLAAGLASRVSFRLAAVGIGAAALVLAHAYSPSKPTGLLNGTAVWNLSRTEIQTIGRSELAPLLTAVAAQVPADARLGIDLTNPDWEYPLWGPHLTRHLVWLPSGNPLGAADAEELNWVVLGAGVIAAPAPGWCTERFRSSGWAIAHRC